VPVQWVSASREGRSVTADVIVDIEYARARVYNGTTTFWRDSLFRVMGAQVTFRLPRGAVDTVAVKSLALHEWGHVIGLPDDSKTNSAMHPQQGGAFLTAHDVQMWMKRARGLGLSIRPVHSDCLDRSVQDTAGGLLKR